MGGHWNEAPIKEGMFLGGYVSFALRGKFSQLDFNQFNFCRQRLCMGDLFFEQGIGLYIHKIIYHIKFCAIFATFKNPLSVLAADRLPSAYIFHRFDCADTKRLQFSPDLIFGKQGRNRMISCIHCFNPFIGFVWTRKENTFFCCSRVEKKSIVSCLFAKVQNSVPKFLGWGCRIICHFHSVLTIHFYGSKYLRSGVWSQKTWDTSSS